MAAEQQENVSINPKQSYLGLNLNSIIPQVKPGQLTWSVNAVVEGFDGGSITYQNEQANVKCTNLPDGYQAVGTHNIIEEGIIVIWLANPSTGDSEIGTIENCVYTTKINAVCIGLSVDRPILKAVHRKFGCDTLVFWTDGGERRYINLNNLPYKTTDGCPPTTSGEIDCNLLRVQPNFSIPQIILSSVDGDGELTAGTYQYAIAYSDVAGNEYTSYYSVSNPLPVFDNTKITLDFNYTVSKSVNLQINNIDVTGYFDYFNLAVIKTVNNISSVELVGTYQITADSKTITYTGQGVQDRLTIADIFQKYPIYKTADDITTAQDVLIWKGLTTDEQISYQRIANEIKLEWQTWKLSGDRTYANPLYAAYLRGYMRDEIYPYEIVFLLKNGKQTDGFHIPGRLSTATDLELVSGNDVISGTETECDPLANPQPRWKVYNTGCIENFSKEYTDYIEGTPSIPGGKSNVSVPTPPDPPIDTNPNNPNCYVGPYQYGCFAYWESTETYPCDEDVWGELANKPIRHHKFPDNLLTHIHDNEGNIYPIGVRINVKDIWDLIHSSTLSPDQQDAIIGFKIVRGSRVNNKSVKAKGIINNVGKYSRDDQTYFFPNYPYNDLREDPFLLVGQSANDSGRNEPARLNAFGDDDSKKRWTFHSPDTHFFQPTLGNILKLETAEFGLSRGHFQQVRNHSRYKFLSTGAYAISLGVAIGIGFASSSAVVGNIFNGTAAYTAYTVLLDIIEKVVPRCNFTYQYNSVGNYTDYANVQNDGNKQRFIDLASYMSPGMIGIGDVHTVNNFQRESSVYLRTSTTLPFPNTIANVPLDVSRYLNSDVGCGTNITETPISTYYASIKQTYDNQYGQIYSYDTVDTGFQWFFKDEADILANPVHYVFGGDVFINRFAYKCKLPFFLDNRVSLNNSRVFPDEADISYSTLGNVAYPTFWFDTDSTAGNTVNIVGVVFGVKPDNFDCDENPTLYQKGKIYLFSYGIPYFYCESEVNVDLRQAFNTAEGDFYPRVSSDIPDEWLQETNTTIQQDNTYYYNKTYSKQNKENTFTHFPEGLDVCTTEYFPFRAIFSDVQNTGENVKNNWLIYRPDARFDFPQNYGKLISLDGIEMRQVLARFENKTLLYNALLTAPTSAADVYLGQSLFSSQVPPLDYADTDLGYAGTQHKFFLKTPYGHVTCDAKRGQVFLLNGQQAKEISNENVSQFFTTYFDFQLKKAFPDYNIDNNYNGVGLHGVFDTKYDRLLITKLDYLPLVQGIEYTNGKFYYGDKEISLSDKEWFRNYSFTISYSFIIQNWASFHTYIPKFYIGEANYFYSYGDGAVWTHNTEIDKYNNFYDTIHPYILEYAYSYQYNDEILQNIKDYTKAIQYTSWQSYIETDDAWWDQAVLWNNQQSSGILKLSPKPQNSLSSYNKYPVYNSDSKEVVFTKKDNFYQINTFWALNKSPKSPMWTASDENLSIFKEVNQANMDYGKRSFKKAPLRAKDLKIQLSVTTRDDTRFISNFITAPTQKSYI